MRPVVLVNHLLEPPAAISGVTNYLFSLLGALLRRGEFRIVLATRWAAEALPSDLAHPDLDVRTFAMPRSMPLNVLLQHRTIGPLMNQVGAAVEFNPNPIGCFDARPRVIVVHDLYFDLAPALYRRRHTLWWRLLFPRAVGAATGIVCVSAATRDELAKRYDGAARKAVVIHEASSVTPRPLPALIREPFGLYVANLSPNKNVDLLVEALSVLRRRGRDVVVNHVGRDELGLVAQAQRRHRTSSGPRSIGTVDDASLSSLYSRAALFVCTSTHEGFCLPLAEAQAHGTPVVATDIPVLREVAGDAALFVDPHDAHALASAMMSVLDDPVLAADLSRRGRANATRFSWDRAAAETSSLLSDIIRSPPGPTATTIPSATRRSPASAAAGGDGRTGASSDSPC